MKMIALVLTLTLQQLTDAAFRGERVDANVARAEYTVAFAEWIESQNIGGDSALAVAMAKRAMASVDRALALDPKLVEAHVLRSRIAFILMFHRAMPFDQAGPLMTEALAAAKAIDPDDPLVTSLDATFLYYGRNGQAEGRALLRRSIDAMAARAAAKDEEAVRWLPIVWEWYGFMLMSDAEMEQARAAFESALAVRPDFAYLRTAMLPMTELVEAGTVPKFSRGEWTAIVSDPEGDGRSKTLPDLRSVAWRTEGDRVWFRFALAAAPDPSRIGVNLALDVDDDPANGGTWWAGNNGFRYDRVVTVWVARGRDGRYRGSSGVADAAGIVRGRFTTSPAGTVAFGIDGENLLVGVKRDALDGRGKMRVVATVGSNMDWNDVAPAEGSALLDLH